MANASESIGAEKCDINYLVAPLLFKIPVINDLLSWFNVGPAVGAHMKRQMKKGTNIALLPGGFHEAALFTRGKYKVFIKKRTGFIKYALQYGYTIRPTFCFGEEKTYYTCNKMEAFRMFLANYNIPPVWFASFWTILPSPNLTMNVVVGEELVLPTIENPTKEEVSKWHEVYVERLVDVFEKNKKEYGEEDGVLEIH
jgi:2-acylglycerol O-acyltransferase 2